jgi:hypothetical protein
MNKKKLNKSGYVFHQIPNTKRGEEFVKQLRSFLNSDRYTIRKKFQHSFPGTYKGNQFKPSLNKDEAKHIRLYIDDTVANRERQEYYQHNRDRDLRQKEQIACQSIEISALQIKVNGLERELIKLKPVEVPVFAGNCLCSVNTWILAMHEADLLFHFDDDVMDIEWRCHINPEQLEYIHEVQGKIQAICNRNNIDVFKFYPDLKG